MQTPPIILCQANDLPAWVVVPMVLGILGGILWLHRAGGAGQLPVLQEDDLTARAIGIYLLAFTFFCGGYSIYRTVSEVIEHQPEIFFFRGQIVLATVIGIIGLTLLLAGSASCTVFRLGATQLNLAQWIFLGIVLLISLGAEFAFQGFLSSYGYVFD